ncbi:MAG: outer membrane protein assembly factor BamD [Proteobacteria bacterium]|nr:outer membrane protein assembly factor BamD [Pseudomonadota bacterium]
MMLLRATAQEVTDPAEQGAFDAAAKAFQDLNFERAEREFGQFARTFPESSLRSEAVLLQARARYSRTNAVGAIDLLTTGLPQAGKLADQYQFWLGEARFEAKQYEKAAEAYGHLVRDFTNSPHLFAAAHHEALARFRLGQHSNVVALLRGPDRAFQVAAKASPTNSLAVSGHLLLGESLLAIHDYPGAERAARVLDGLRLEKEDDWRRRFLLGRTLIEAGRPAEALPETTNLVHQAEVLAEPVMRAESYALQGLVLEKLGLLSRAVDSLTNNFATNAPAELRRRALVKSVDLSLAQPNHEPQTVALLELFSTQYPTDPSLDFAQLKMGELRLWEFVHHPGGTTGTNGTVGRTNILLAALTNLNQVVLTYTNSPLRNEAFYQRGWCFWHLRQPAEAAADFEMAAQRLPKSEDQAVARIKLGEALAQLKDYTNALRNFALVVEQYADDGRVRTNYLDKALEQQMRVALAVTNLTVAEDAVARILQWFPAGNDSEKVLLLFGTELNRMTKPVAARSKFQMLLDRFPNSAFAPDAHLGIASSYHKESDWTNAVRTLDEWVLLFPTNSARAEVEYLRAEFTDLTGGTNALSLFTNFVVRFPAHVNAPRAQYRVGDYYFSQGDAYDKAEASYQLVFQNTNWPDGELKYRARLSAGRAALARGEQQGYQAATNYFVGLVNDQRTPKDILAEAFFALGDTYLSSSQGGVNIGVDPFGDAINAYNRITNNFPTSRQAAYAMGQIGNCHLQRAAKNGDAKELELAAGAYLKAMNWPGAEAEARSLAEVALGDVRAKQNRPVEAVENWSNVFYQKNLRPGESRNLGAIREAGLFLAKLRESQGDWAAARQIYLRMQEMFPALRRPLQEKIDRAQKMLNERR